MSFNYVKISKNPRQRRVIRLGEFRFDCRIEWNNRSNRWYVLMYLQNELVFSNTKMTDGEFHRFDSLLFTIPYQVAVVSNNPTTWDTETVIVFMEDFLTTGDQVSILDYGYNQRETSTFTHAAEILDESYNSYLFDIGDSRVVSFDGLTCPVSRGTFKTSVLPTGTWDYTINGVLVPLVDEKSLVVKMRTFGLEIEKVSDGWLWTNTTDSPIKLRANYPYEKGHALSVTDAQNVKVLSTDDSNNVNDFIVCI